MYVSVCVCVHVFLSYSINMSGKDGDFSNAEFMNWTHQFSQGRYHPQVQECLSPESMLCGVTGVHRCVQTSFRVVACVKWWT